MGQSSEGEEEQFANHKSILYIQKELIAQDNTHQHHNNNCENRMKREIVDLNHLLGEMTNLFVTTFVIRILVLLK